MNASVIRKHCHSQMAIPFVSFISVLDTPIMNDVISIKPFDCDRYAAVLYCMILNLHATLRMRLLIKLE